MNESAIVKTERPYFENLNALRFIAALAVFLFHYFREINGHFTDIAQNRFFRSILGATDKGRLGVNFFFVLSGFLITYLILHERKTREKFNLKLFFQRRILRIWPLYLIIGTLGLLIVPNIFSNLQNEYPVWYYFFFLANFNEAYAIGNGLNFLTSPWSVAVEEQFYLFWGFLMLIFFKTKKIKFTLLIFALVLTSLCFQWTNQENERILYYHTLSVIPDLLLGAIVGWGLFGQKKWVLKFGEIQRWILVAIYLLGLGLCLFKDHLFTGWLVILERIILSSFFAFVILDQTIGKNSFIKFGKVSLFNHFGKISYGIYMYHLFIFFLLNQLVLGYISISFIGAITYFLLGFTGTILLAELSYYFIEKPLLKLKKY